VLGLAIAADVNRLTETDPHRFAGVEPSKIFSPLAHAPGIGFHGHGDHRHLGPFSQFDPEGVELYGKALITLAKKEKICNQSAFSLVMHLVYVPVS